MQWWVCVLLCIMFMVIGYMMGKDAIVRNYHMGTYDVINDILYYDDDVDPLELEEKEPNVAVIDLIYLKPKKIAKKRGDI